MILHIPHSSRKLPDNFDLNANIDLNNELDRMTDHLTDELFFNNSSDILIAEYSRLYCDVERYYDDKEEMFSKGMGICYTKDSYGRQLRKTKEIDIKEKEYIIKNIYEEHHKKLNIITNKQLAYFNKVILVDCHSFSNKALNHEIKSTRPDFCIGTNSDTPRELIDLVIKYIKSQGKTVLINHPFSGSIVPSESKDNSNLISIMIEVNRDLYNSKDKDKYISTKKIIKELLSTIELYEDKINE